MTQDDEAKRDAIFRGNLLELSSFLTKLQSHLVPEDLSRVVPSTSEGEDSDDGNDGNGRSDYMVVTPQDLKKVFEYRDLLKEEEELLNGIAAAEEMDRYNPFLGKLCRLMIYYIKVDLEKNQASLKKCTTRTKRVHLLWNRLEVWWTKMVAQELLVSSAKAFSEDPSRLVVCCFSPLLNLPASQHFRAILPEPVDGMQDSVNLKASAFYQNPLSCCSLPLPPNKHTWKEFARISRMVALLEKEPEDGRRTRNRSPHEQALRSPCCIHDALINKTKHIQAAQNQHFEFAGPHLIALWVRAQRNTQAMRHLWMIFEVYVEVDRESSSQAPALIVRGGGARGMGKHLVVDSEQQTEVTPMPIKIRSFVPLLRGNPNYLRSRLVDASKRADQLVEWTVTNQVLFTHRHIQKYIMMAPGLQKDNGIDAAIELEERQRKRIRRDFSQDSDLGKLRAACQSFVLRWFARRNRAVSMFVFDSGTQNYHLDVGWSKSDTCNKMIFDRVNTNIKVLLQEKGDKMIAVNRSFARVDRRMSLNYGEGGISLLVQLKAILDALEKSQTWNALEFARIQHAKKDIEELHQYFFGRSRDLYDIALDLVNKETDDAGEITDLLNSAPKPWPGGCSVCKLKEGDFVCCTNCEKIYHTTPETCSFRQASQDFVPNVKVEFAQLVESHKALQRLCRLERQAGNHRVPDYTNDQSIEHEVVVIDIEREQSEDGSVTPLGLSLRAVEECASVFDRLNSDAATVLDLVDILNKECQSEKKRSIYPMKGLRGAYVVVDAKDENACAKAAGIKVGDVILSVEHLQIANPEQAAKYKALGVAKMTGLPKAQKAELELLRVPSTTLRITVVRSNKNIVQESKDWFATLKHKNKSLTTLLREGPVDLWYCKKCLVTEVPPNIPDSSSSRIVEEALRCRAVIRRVGLENYALPFVDADIFSIQTARENGQRKDGTFFCLRRLDAMMTSIIEVHSRNDDVWPFSSAFMLPPWAMRTGPTRRLEWSPESVQDKPVDLLVSGLLSWQEFSEFDESRKVSKMKTIRHFLLLVASWCVLPCPPGESIERTVGPPELFLRVREPWLRRSCLFCCSRPRDDGSVACHDTTCARMSRKDLVNMDDIGHEDAQKVYHEVVEYNECSSLVGTTFLVLPDDPLIQALKAVVGRFDYHARPIEFIVASYLPAAFVSEAISMKPKDPFFDKFGDNEGVFHLLPVIHDQQLKYLLERCKVRGKATDRNDCRDFSWVSLDVFNEPGVARYSLQELKKKITESDSIRRSIDDFVATENGVNVIEANIPFSGSRWSMKSGGGLSVSSSQKEANTVGSQKHLVDRFLRKGVLPESIRRALANEVAGEPDGTTWETEFGDTHLQEGLQITNSTPIVLDIVKPDWTGCVLLYSDLHYALPMEMPSLTEALVPRSLLRPEKHSESTVMTILLERSNHPPSSEDYKGVGFGFEVFRWGRDKSLFIGRVHLHSPAFSAGLKCGDILLSAGGKDVAELTSISELATALLGARMHIRLASNSDEPLRLVLSAVKESKMMLDSVVLVVERPKQEVRGNTKNVQSLQTITQQEIQREDATSETEPQDSDAFSIWQQSFDQGPANQAIAEGPVEAEGSPQRPLHDSPMERSPVDPGAAGLQRQTNGVSPGRFEPTNPHPAPAEPLPLPQEYQNPPGQVGRQHKRASNLDRLYRSLVAVAASAMPRTTATFGHLYRPAGGGTIFTMMESALLLECVQNAQPRLGLRLLCPRYEMRVVVHQLGIVSNWSEEQIRAIPRLPRSVYEEMLRLDYRRANSEIKPEVGPVIFREGLYEYKAPVGILPVDRAIERSLQREREEQEAQRHALEAHYQSTIDPGYLAARQPPQDGFYFSFDHDTPTHFSGEAHAQEHLAHRGYHRDQEHGLGYRDDPSHAHALGHPPNMYHAPRSDRGVSPIQYPPRLPLAGEANALPPPNGDSRLASISFGGSADHAIALDDNEEEEEEDNIDLAYRIRGGGPLEDAKESYGETVSPELEQQSDCFDLSSSNGPQDATRYLTQLPLDEWAGLAVYSYVQTDDASSSDTLMVGWIKNVAPSGDEVPETVDVEAHYLASMGYFATPNIFLLDPEDIFVVDEHSETEQATVIKTLRAQGRAPEVVRPSRDKAVPLCQESTLVYARSLGEGLKVLGELPDAREVVWLSNDPSALYLAKAYEEECLRKVFRDYTDFIGKRMDPDPIPASCPKLTVRAGEICCPWGCSVQMNESNDARDCLFFSSIDDFRLHYEDCHSYGSVADTVDLGDGRLFTRVCQGKELLELSSSISSAIVAQLPSAWLGSSNEPLPKIRLPSGTEFSKSPTGEKLLLPWTETSFRTTLSRKARQSENQNLRAVVDLWVAMGKLFEIDGSGLFRLTQSQFEAIADRQINRANDKRYHVTNCCQFIPPSDGTSTKRFLDCALCSLPWERCIGKPTSSTSTTDEFAPDNTVNDSTGLGCVLRSDASFQKSNVSGGTAFPGEMGEAKALLLQVAELIPAALKLSNRVDEVDPLEGLRIWDETYRDEWKAFVRDCSTPPMFSQALTVLLGSIDRKKMPSWWKQDGGGWSTSQMIMANTSMETFFLHLYVLDAALSESIGRSFLPQEAKESLARNGTDRSSLLQSLMLQMEKYMSFAKELGERLYNGEHDSDCMFCDEGGDLLCCELCSNVQHAQCLEPPLTHGEATSLNLDWVCDSCINDLCAKKGVEREDIEKQYASTTETESAPNED